MSEPLAIALVLFGLVVFFAGGQYLTRRAIRRLQRGDS